MRWAESALTQDFTRIPGKDLSMQTLRNKLQSRSGASITFALLMFLVCAVVGSVVLAAGTAASGRLSQLAEMDQRYYAVTSASDLMEEIVGAETGVVAAKITVTKIPYNVEGEPQTPTEAPAVTYTVDGTKSTELASQTLIQNAALNMIQGDSAWGEAASITKQFTLTLPEQTNPLTVTETLAKNGTMILEISNSDTTGQIYTLKQTYQLEKKTEKTENTVQGPVKPTGREDTKTVTETVTMNWKLIDTQKVVK